MSASKSNRSQPCLILQRTAESCGEGLLEVSHGGGEDLEECHGGGRGLEESHGGGRVLEECRALPLSIKSPGLRAEMVYFKKLKQIHKKYLKCANKSIGLLIKY